MSMCTAAGVTAPHSDSRTGILVPNGSRQAGLVGDANVVSRLALTCLMRQDDGKQRSLGNEYCRRPKDARATKRPEYLSSP